MLLIGAGVFAVAELALAPATNVLVAGLLLFLVGTGFTVWSANSQATVQLAAPDRLRGRTMAVYSMMFMGMAPFGALFAGSVAERIGAPHTVVFGGIVCIGAAILFALRLPSIRAEARQLIVAQGLAGGDPPAEVTGTGAEASSVG